MPKILMPKVSKDELDKVLNMCTSSQIQKYNDCILSKNLDIIKITDIGESKKYAHRFILQSNAENRLLIQLNIRKINN